MKYTDGTIIRVGDLVWWNGGGCLGYVQVVAETRAEYERWGLTSPHIFVSNRHPFDISLGSAVAHNESCFEDEGISLVTPQEKLDLKEAARRARTRLKADSADLTYTVTTEVQDCRQIGWIFTFFSNGAEVETVRIPVFQNDKST